MAFQKLPGNRGMIYVPEGGCGKKKHPCPDCFSCQWCSNERCRSCRGGKSCRQKKAPAENTGESAE